MPSDEQLIQLLQDGQAEALDAIIDRYSGYAATVIDRVASGALRQSDLEEAVADVFIALWQNAARIQSGAKLKPYLAAIARNKARGSSPPAEKRRLFLGGRCAQSPRLRAQFGGRRAGRMSAFGL